MNQDQLLGWLIVAAILNTAAWTWGILHIHALRGQLSKERLLTAHLRERIEPMHAVWRSEQTSASAPSRNDSGAGASLRRYRRPFARLPQDAQPTGAGCSASGGAIFSSFPSARAW